MSNVESELVKVVIILLERLGEEAIKEIIAWIEERTKEPNASQR